MAISFLIYEKRSLRDLFYFSTLHLRRSFLVFSADSRRNLPKPLTDTGTFSGISFDREVTILPAAKTF